MTSPIQKAVVKCPNCKNIYMDWWQPTTRTASESFDEEYRDQCESALCPICKTKVYFKMLAVIDGVFHMPEREKVAKE